MQSHSHVDAGRARLCTVGLLAAVLAGCAGGNPYLMGKDAVKEITSLAIVPTDRGNVEMTSTATNERLLVVTSMLQDQLKLVKGFSVIAVEESAKRWQESEKDLGIEGYFDPKTGQVDQRKLDAVTAHFLDKIGAQGVLFSSLQLGLASSTAGGLNPESVTSESVDLNTEIRRRDGAAVWRARALIAPYHKRVALIPVPGIGTYLSLGKRRWKNFTIDQILSDSNIDTAVKKCTKSLRSL